MNPVACPGAGGRGIREFTKIQKYQLRTKVFQKNQFVVFPTCVDTQAVSYPVAPPTGRMVFKIIGVAADAPNVDLVADLNAEAGYFELHQKDLSRLLQTLSTLPPSAWWEESVDFWILE